MGAIIYQRPKNAMQSGRARTDRWVLEFERDEPQVPDPLTGWAGSGDTDRQLRLTFPTCDSAVDYAQRRGLAYTIVPTPARTLKIQAYADNFR